MRKLCAAFVLVVATGLSADAAGNALGRGLQAVQSMAGCYLVDYSYTEVESLKPGYTRDARVYDVNRDKSAKEWITAEMLSPRRVRLQRILFLTDLRGVIREGSVIKHQSEGLGVRRAVPLRLRRAPELAGARSQGNDGPVDPPGHEPRRRPALPVRGALGDGHGLSGVDVLELRADSRP
jgi:hypothetical protein